MASSNIIQIPPAPVEKKGHSTFPEKLKEKIPLDSIHKAKANAYSRDLLPSCLNNWIYDCAERMQFPHDFMAIPMIISVASLISDKFKVCPKQHDNSWVVTPNLWGMLIGEPSAGKSPMLQEALGAIHHIENSYFENTSVEKRSVVRDATTEKIGEILSYSKQGILLCRDELDGWLSSLNKAGRENDRSFFLESFNGNSPYTYDRIKRGTIHIEKLNISIIGGIQPSKLNKYIQDVIRKSSGNDGFLQRFQLAVWPEEDPSFKLVDRAPDLTAKEEAYNVINNAYKACTEMKSSKTLNFSLPAQEAYNDFVIQNRNKISSGDLHESLSAHFGKYDSLIASLSLIFQVLENPYSNEISLDSLTKARKLGEYLESHAVKIYPHKRDQDIENARRIYEEKKKLPDTFNTRQIELKGWGGLTKREAILGAIKKLLEHHYIEAVKQEKTSTKGRQPLEAYRWI